MNEYLVPAGAGKAEYIEKRSRFIGAVYPCETEAEALEWIKKTGEEHREARHNVYAYIIKENNIMRYSDNGEPQGTAGMPTLEVFRREGVENVVCITTRYFGGILLGAGGLTRAYAHTAKLALDAAGIAQMREWAQFSVVIPYQLFEIVKRMLEDNGAILENTDYGADVTVFGLIPMEEFELLSARIIDGTAGQIKPEKLGSKFMGVKIR